MKYQVGAEYATIYERVECNKIIERATEDQTDTIVILDQKVKQLEAERSELLKAVDLLKRTRYPFPEQPTLQEEIELFLNSLKTK